MHGLVGPSNPLLPASEMTLIYFASHLAKTVSYDTVKLYLVAVQDLHRECNLPLHINKMHRLQKVLTGIKRLAPLTRRDRFPITTQILTAIHNYLRPALSTNLDHIMLWAAFTLAFSAFLRTSEFTCNGPFNPEVHLTSQDITFHPDLQSPSLMRVRIKQSKTDPFRQGCTLTIAKSTSPICSVMAMKGYILQAQPPASRPLFTFSQSGSWPTRSCLTKELRFILQQCGFPSNNFYAHSFRIGAATSAAAAGVPAWLIKVLGRWSSDCYERYIQTPQSTILTVPKLLVSHRSSHSLSLPCK
ncbi:uncharacterized protein LOC110045991 [Orbicella faveolata]|uniref:uncharacterized protein LOC110045991 n=1 Tax=Orbicella faveolata TaxID=48498 RepID=UPI0009E25071|nr:uncharacterized protein LOC110045991 [Orbicella faveolata]